ncbi:MAG: hypothetical protein COW32_06205 [Candidatus Aquicultor secundus]|uniref:Tail specific protease domain-containing protein n=2 Tax=Candidatus Aquicultor secundus TaxID=1973895 RepID=A0A2M7T7N0_9ACTN|nr:MAG: hypothetical protein COT10_01855 [Candidatus Aquicultor secundus]PIW22131.1 MAG: hypothetical protein COW32_06205 [Candidatus Aquicultor secundus]PIX53071.1 MAG: hypothetical protein COZ51_00745 [Candidatus Aquicultor secundus]PIY38316.1 MAG: hypothetical protein COZ03_08440 [Candidatus Aquicultor secundus]PIZ38395.1 MAG: hypothetical protein COY37_06215 [Candidatus Aquicultor secundus]
MKMSTINALPIEKTRIEIFEQIWDLVYKKYPLFKERDVDWFDIKNKYSGRIIGIDSYDRLYRCIDDMLLELKDPHTRILSSPWFKPMIYPFLVMAINDDCYISHILAESSELAPGMKILSVNGILIEDLKRTICNKFLFSSKNMQTVAFVNELMGGDLGDSVEIEATDGQNVVVGRLAKQDIGVITGVNLDSDDSLSNDYKREILKPCLVKIFDHGVGYIKILSFRYEGVVKTFKAALEQCRKASSLIIDVRGNHGGLIAETVRIASIFTPRNKIIGYRLAKQGEREKILVEPERDIDHDFRRIMLLCDESTMSSSEFIFLNALKGVDERIKLVGRQTAGLAHEATIYTLFDGTKLQITTFKYLTPEGRVMEEAGILPDLEVLNSVVLITKQEDAQLDRAIELCRN